MKEEFDEIFDSALMETSRRLLPLTVEDYLGQTSSDEPRRVNAAKGEEYIVYQLRDQQGRVVLHSHDAQAEPFDAPLEVGFSNTATHRIFTDSAVSGTLFLQTADPLDERREAMRETATAMLLPLLPLVPLSVLSILFVVRRALAPLELLRREIADRDSGNLAALPAIDLPAELRPIADTVDKLLNRLRTALEGEREFATNSAHELRTPLAGALAHTQRLLRELPRGPARARALEIQTALKRLNHLMEKLLELSRADSGIGLAEEVSDLLPIIEMVADEFARSPGNAGRLRLDLGDADTLMAQVDIDAFAIALRNLIENALVHSPPETMVEVTLHADGRVSVRNECAIVPAAPLRDMTKRFKRGATDANGSGLGLAIAATFVDRMGGDLTLTSPASDRPDGFEAVISLRPGNPPGDRSWR
jgi:two-component system OmpR family sensor kinase